MKKFRNFFNSIHTVDKCLCVLMIILLSQSAYTLFFPNSDFANIDIIVRTSAASIFGYFLSANFMHNTDKSKSDLPLTAAESKIPPLSTDHTQKEAPIRLLQIIAATFIGVFCLVILLIYNNFIIPTIKSTPPTSVFATLTQFRDFVSGCIGFLIGCPTNSKQ